MLLWPLGCGDLQEATLISGNRLKEMLGSFWPLLFYGVPAVFSIITTIISLKKEYGELREKYEAIRKVLDG